VKLKDTILKDLNNSIIPSYNRYIIQKVYFLDLLEELKEEGYIDYNIVKDNFPPFSGEPKEIKLTEKGLNKVNK